VKHDPLIPKKTKITHTTRTRNGVDVQV